MIQNLFYFLYISLVCISWGMPVVLTVKKKDENIVTFGFEKLLLSFFCGLTILAVVTSWIGLFGPVPLFLIETITSLLLIIETFWWKKNKCKGFNLSSIKRLSPGETIFILCCALLFFFLGSGKPVLEDTELYHIQSIKWIHNYGTVPGLANLYLRYGFYSNWFQLISLFYLPIKHQNFLYLNITFSIWLLFYIFFQYKKYSHEKSKIINKQYALYNFFLIIYMLFEWDLFRVGSSSTSYDFVITGITLIAIDIILQRIINSEAIQNKTYILLLLLISAPFFKITGFLTLPLIVYYCIFYKVDKKVLFFLLGFGGLALCPFICKNFIQTGYPFYPYRFFNVLHPDWQVPSQLLNRFNAYISLGNHYINQSIPSLEYEKNSSFSYFTNWFQFLTLQDKFIVILSFISFPLNIPIIKSLYKEKFPLLLALFSITYIMIFIWLYFSPDTRFAFNYLLFNTFFPLSCLLRNYFKQGMYNIVFLILAILIIAYIFYKTKETKLSNSFIYPASIETPPFKIVRINNVDFHLPEMINQNWNRRCLNTPLPCIYQMNPYLRTRGTSYKQGFRMVSFNDSSFIETYYY